MKESLKPEGCAFAAFYQDFESRAYEQLIADGIKPGALLKVHKLINVKSTILRPGDWVRINSITPGGLITASGLPLTCFRLTQLLDTGQLQFIKLTPHWFPRIIQCLVSQDSNT